MKLKKMKFRNLKPHLYFRHGRWQANCLMQTPSRPPNYWLYKRASMHAKKLNAQLKQPLSPQEASSQ